MLINQAAFGCADGQWGSLRRNSIRLPGIGNVDTALTKGFNFTERAKLTFRFEVFNLFNHPEVWGMRTWGTAASTRSRRRCSRCACLASRCLST